jgi:hypothetical protein
LSKSVVRFAWLGVLLIAGLAWWRVWPHQPNKVASGSTIEKTPSSFTMHTFDSAAPPSDMPPLGAEEAAQCDSNFISDARVTGETERIDSTHAVVTLSRANVTLQLNISVWVPAGASQHVIEHEQGHRQISEYYYRNADKLAEQIAVGYIGRQISVGGSDLDAEIRKVLQKMGADITAEYNHKLNPGPAQQRYDDITDHSRNDIAASDAVSRALLDI